MQQIVPMSPLEQARCVLSITAAFWQVKPRPAHAWRAPSGNCGQPREARSRPPDSERLEHALAQGWRWGI